MNRASRFCEALFGDGRFLLLLLSADAAFIGAHLVHTFSPALSSPLFSLETEQGHAEAFQYIKLFWATLMLAVLWRPTGESVCLAWAGLSGYLLCDDVFQWHERGGAALAGAFGFTITLGLRAEDLGEIAVSASVALVFLAAIAYRHAHSGVDSRNTSQDLGLLIAVIAFFGVVVDMIHVLAGDGLGGAVFAVLEDGGEMVSVSLLAGYVFALQRRGGRVPVALWRLGLAALAAQRQPARSNTF